LGDSKLYLKTPKLKQIFNQNYDLTCGKEFGVFGSSFFPMDPFSLLNILNKII